MGINALNEVIYYSTDFNHCYQAIWIDGVLIDTDGDKQLWELGGHRFIVNMERQIVDVTNLKEMKMNDNRYLQYLMILFIVCFLVVSLKVLKNLDAIGSNIESQVESISISLKQL